MLVRPRLALPGLALAALPLLAGAAFPPPLRAAEATPPPLTLERIMADPDWIGNAPEDPYWSDDSQAVYYEQKRQGSELRDLYRVDLGGVGAPVKVADAERGSISVAGGEWSRDRTKKVYVREGDVYVRDLASGEVRQLTRTAEDEEEPEFLTGAGDGATQVAYRRGEAIFVRDLATGLERQAADLEAEKDPEEEEAQDEADAGYLERQQERLFEVIRKDKAEDEAERRRERELQATDPTRAPLPFYLGDDVEVTGMSLAPSGRFLLVSVADSDRDEGEAALMPEYVTESGYVETEKERPKVGTGDGKGERLLLLDLERHEQQELDWAALPGIDVDPLAELRAAADARSEEREEKAGAAAGDEASASGEEANEDEGEEDEEGAEEPDLRAVSVGEVAWNRAGDRAAVMVFSRDDKDRWIATVDLQGARLVPRERLTDPAWINWDFNEMGWLGDGSTLWLLSEESGYSQLYLHPLAGDGGAHRRLTPGGSVVSDVVLSPDDRYLYYLDNQGDPAVYEVYRVGVAGGAPEKLTTLGGLNAYALSPDGDRLLVTHSTAVRPPDLWLQEAAPGASARRLTDTVSAAYQAIDWTPPEIVPVPSSHVDRPIWSRLYLPAGFDPRRAEPYPAVVFIHGAGYLQDAHAGWSYYFREHMFHALLTRRGCVVLDMDYRGSAGYGREWRTAIYRDMGHPEARGPRGRRRLAGGDPRRRPAAGGGLRRLLRRLSHLDGPVPRSRPVRGRRRDPAGHRLGALQRPVYLEHLEHAGPRPGGLRAQLAHRVRRGPRRSPGHPPRHGRRQRLLPGHGAPRPEADRARQAGLVGGLLPGRGPRLPGAVELARRLSPDRQAVRGARPAGRGPGRR